MRIDNFKRYQIGLKLKDLFPERNDGICACGCNQRLTGKKKRWASSNCQDKAVTDFLTVKGDSFTIRSLLFNLDQGYCQHCGVYSENWEADHILPVHKGGGGCYLENFQTLCKDCHKLKNYTESHRNTISSQAASILSMRLLIADGAVSNELLKQSNEIHTLESTDSSVSKIFELTY